MYTLFVCVQLMQDAATMSLTVNCLKSMAEIAQSVAKILGFLRLSAKTKTGVHRQCGGCIGCSCQYNGYKGLLQPHGLQSIQKIWQEYLIPMQRTCISSVRRLG
jgi:hypothetical protein